jgi:hypothetical protein
MPSSSSSLLPTLVEVWGERVVAPPSPPEPPPPPPAVVSARVAAVADEPPPPDDEVRQLRALVEELRREQTRHAALLFALGLMLILDRLDRRRH